MTMIEQAAKAMWSSDYYEAHLRRAVGPRRGRRPGPKPMTWDEIPDISKHYWIFKVRAAFAGIREPTPKVLAATEGNAGAVLIAWQAMIDAILSEESA